MYAIRSYYVLLPSAEISEGIISSFLYAGPFITFPCKSYGYRWLKRQNGKVVLKQQRELKTLFRSVYEKRSFDHLSEETQPYGANYLYDLYSFYQNVITSYSIHYTKLYDSRRTCAKR